MIVEAPFAASAAITALEKAEGMVELKGADPRKIPLVGIVNDRKDIDIKDLVTRFIGEGYTTLKIKLMGDPGSDIKRAKAAQEASAGKTRLRFDANGSYTPKTIIPSTWIRNMPKIRRSKARLLPDTSLLHIFLS